MAATQSWEIWLPEPGATGILFARSRIAPADVVWIHAAPAEVSVVVREGDDRPIARGENLRRPGERLPMTRLTRTGDRISREDRWPTPADLGAVVILPGGEAGTLIEWWHAADESEWRWRIEFYNHR